ncbi:hypothetical protein DPMN_004776 [Dreissena polymorpha]|uniref:Uncharacterized protein n=1 Tax=Dreissena polymorpha TaxID=45954 RepID=A0A9D4MS77_DREPO|nr:hypothetical protein DPMN_004776 [Dreissena polymorpha]
MKSRQQTNHFNYFHLNDYGRYEITSKSSLTNICVDNCEASEFQFNNTCLSACPSDVHYVTNGHCGKGPCATDFYYN